MDRRVLGKTGQELSIVGFGGIVVMNVEPAEASRLVAEAIDRGVNYFDVAPTYGNAEERLGPLEAAPEARDAGLIRHIGFSAHSVETALAAMDRFDFDSVLFPTNFVLYYQANFGPQVIERAQQKGVGRLALKAMARTPWAE